MGVAHTYNEGGAYMQWGWRIHAMGVAHTSKGGSVYIQWGWRIHLMGVAYKYNGPILPMGLFLIRGCMFMPQYCNFEKALEKVARQRS